MKEIVQDIIKSHAGSAFHWRVGTRVEHPRDGLVEITSGYYLDPTYGRVSNFWTWRKVREDGTLGSHHYHGYGWK